jgi:hypothetical protein
VLELGIYAQRVLSILQIMPTLEPIYPKPCYGDPNEVGVDGKAHFVQLTPAIPKAYGDFIVGSVIDTEWLESENDCRRTTG